MQLETSNELIVVFTAGILILFLLSGYIVYFLIFYLKKQQKNIQEKNLREITFQRQLLQSQLEIKEQTLKHIAYELHDNLGQIASLIKINLNTLPLGDSERSAQKLEETKELTRQLITDLKSLSVSLSSDRVTQLGLVRGLEEEVARLNKIGPFNASFDAGDAVPALDENTTIILYRMVQEILNNIIKHSEATRVDIALHVMENLFTLVIVDNGVGFTYEDKLKSGSSGLLNLQSRAKLIQAVFSVQSSPGNGTRISISLPLNHNAQPASN
jgi:signal transduction histidine kinase